MGRQVLDAINSLFIGVTLIYQLVGFIRHYSSSFNNYQWKDPNRAHQLINQGLNIINSNPTVEDLHPIVCSVIKLLPENNRPPIPGKDEG
jgi:molecular chaperone DnaK